jgi:hypothetical protein
MIPIRTAIALSLLLAIPALGQDPPASHPATAPDTAPDAGVLPIVMSISGAISVGAYQAGVNWAILEFMRRARYDVDFAAKHGIREMDLRAVTGASAGNLNTLLWAVEWCTRPSYGGREARWSAPPPDSSLFWKVWIGVGLNSMLPNGSYDRRAMDRAILNRPELRKITDAPLLDRLQSDDLVPGCKVPIGITLTRTRPDVIQYQDLLIETQRFATVFHAVVDPQGPEYDRDRMHFRQLESEPERENHFGRLIRLLPERGRISTKDVLRAVEASAAYPIAFAPVKLDVWYPDPIRGGTAETSVFIDGGVFDNNPVNLALGIYHHEARSGTRHRAYPDSVPPAHVLFINPYRYRQDLARTRTDPYLSVPAAGGIAALGEFLGGAVATARQYELQLLARERQIQERFDAAETQLREQNARLDSLVTELSRWADPATRAEIHSLQQQFGGVSDEKSRMRRDTLAFSSRFYPIYGEHLGAFAGFLGRPLREFDFHVGIYDGIHFAVQNFVCGDRSGAAEAQQCVRRLMAELILDDRFTSAAPHRLLATLYDREHHPDRVAPDRAALVREVRLRYPKLEPADAETDRILLALYQAVGTQFEKTHSAECARHVSLVSRMLCNDGLGPVLRAFGEDRSDVDPHAPLADSAVLAILDRWKRACTPTAPGDCRADDDFVELVRNANNHATLLTERVLDRMEQVERALKADGYPDQSRPLSVLNALYHTTHLRSRKRFEMLPSLHRSANPGWNLIPYSVGSALGRSGWEIRYRPSWNLSARWAVVFPVTLYDDYERRLNPHRRGAIGVGTGGALRAPFPSAGVLVTESGVEGHLLQPVGPRKDGEYLWPRAGLEAYGTFLGGFFRLAVRADNADVRHTSGPFHISGHVALTDLGGLSYWIWRITR